MDGTRLLPCLTCCKSWCARLHVFTLRRSLIHAFQALAPAGSFELGEVRTRMRHLDDLMCALLADGTWVGPDATVWSCLPERYFLCLDAEIHVVCSRVCPERVEMLSMLVSQRLMLAEAHARLLFASRAFACMHKVRVNVLRDRFCLRLCACAAD